MSGQERTFDRWEEVGVPSTAGVKQVLEAYVQGVADDLRAACASLGLRGAVQAGGFSNPSAVWAWASHTPDDDPSAEALEAVAHASPVQGRLVLTIDVTGPRTGTVPVMDVEVDMPPAAALASVVSALLESSRERLGRELRQYLETEAGSAG